MRTMTTAGRELRRCKAFVTAGLFLLVVTVLTTLPSSAHAADDAPQAFARVLTDEAEVRSGPGVSYRVIETLKRGETISLDGRANTGFWLKVILEDGRTAYVLGEQVETFAVNPGTPDAPSRPGLFAPPPLAGARGGLAIMGGLLQIPVADGSNKGFGYMEARPSVVVGPSVTLEGFIAEALTADGSQIFYGAGASVHFAPNWPVCPYLSAGGGRLNVIPQTDSFVLKKEDFYVARAGGGILLALRGRILLRFEATNMTLFTADSFKNAQTYSGGLGVYF
jgi:hypothetical protein